MNLERFFFPFSPPGPNLVNCLRFWTDQQPTEIAFYAAGDNDHDDQLTYANLDRRARAIAANLTAQGMRGERAMLLYPPGLDFVEGFFACMYAGVVAVPAYPPFRTRYLSRIEDIAKDCQAKLALTVNDVAVRTEAVLNEAPTLRNATWLSTDQVADELADAWQQQQLQSDDLAVLQYTSGSTGAPKGVMLAHANLMHNVSLIIHAFEASRSGVGMTWLPTYHDMGLVGGVLMPLFFGRPNVLMSPLAFLQNPRRWLQKITEYKVTISGGPNFAYDLCNDKLADEDLEGLDLSSWEVAFNGAEPIRPSTLKAFTERFSAVGFRPETFYPCYGMAETTLIVTGGEKTRRPIIRSFDGKALDEGRVVPAADEQRGARHLVGCGHVLPEQEVLIVDSVSSERLLTQRVGEICVKSPSVARGYWNNPDETAKAFHRQIPGEKGHFLRTGDLGFIDQAELFVTGRLKDLIIVRGVNRYPHDIERTVEATEPHLRAGVTAAFSVQHGGQECLVVHLPGLAIDQFDLLDFDLGPTLAGQRQRLTSFQVNLSQQIAGRASCQHIIDRPLVAIVERPVNIV